MNKEITTKQKCLITRNGIMIWISESEADTLISLLQQSNESKFIKYKGRLINTADCVGIFQPSDIEDMTRRKNGMWQCQHGNWHDKFEKCNDVDCVINSIKND